MHYSDQDFLSDPYRERKAAEANCDIEYPEPNELQVDIDGPDTSPKYDDFVYQLCLLQDCGILPYEISYNRMRSRNGNTHVVVTLPEPITHERRILLQALLGSDLKREALGFARVLRGAEHPQCLFRPRNTVLPEEDGFQFDPDPNLF